MNNDAEHFFMLLLSMYFLWWRVFFNLYQIFKIVFFFSYVEFENPLFILDKHPLSDIWFSNIILPVCDFLLKNFFEKVFNFDEL